MLLLCPCLAVYGFICADPGQSLISMAVYYPRSWRSVALLIFQFLHSFCLLLGRVSWALVGWVTCLCHLLSAPNPLQREWLKSVSGKLCLGINNTVRRQFDATSIYLNDKVKSPSPIVYDVPCDGLLSGFIVSVMDSFSVVSTLIQSKCRWLPLWVHLSWQVVIIVHDTSMTHSNVNHWCAPLDIR